MGADPGLGANRKHGEALQPQEFVSLPMAECGALARKDARSNMNKTMIGIGAVLTVAGLAVMQFSGLLSAAEPASKEKAVSTVQWDPQASAEVAHALHYMHEVWNAGDMEAVKKVIAGDDVLVTFELGADNKTPVPLRSRAEIVSFIQNIASNTGAVGEEFQMEMPKMNCHATATMGVCTEECTVHLKKSGVDTRVDKLFGTAVAVKYPDGWKWIQWHMSTAPAAQPVLSSALGR